ncbi:MAG: proprotein convertase P-domain-containing protein, partial [Fimbriimonadaceae bacterium]
IIYKSTTGGATWTNIKGNFLNGDANSGANYMWQQKDYDKHLTVSKNGTSDVVYVGLIGINMDVGGDGTWVDISRAFSATPPNYLHADQHCGIPHPTDPTIVYFGLDGGVFKWKLTNAATGAGTWTSLNATIKDYQAYHVSAHPTDPNYLMTGLQDNCTIGSRNNFASWTSLSAGDGSWSAFDRNNPGVQYTSAQGASVYRYPNATTLTATFIKPTAGNFGFIAPLVTAGSAGNEVFLGGDFLYKWSGAGRVWNTLNMPCGSTQPASELAVAPANGNVIYSGNPEGIIVMTRDKGTTYAQIDNANIDRPVGGIGIAFSNSYDVVVGLQGQGGNHLWRCSNTLAGTPVWVNVSGTGSTALPPVPINAVARDPHEVGRWYVGTDVGAFMTYNYGATWISMGTLGLPAVGVQHMTFDANKQYLVIATYGRGIWRVPIVTAVTKFSIAGNIKQGAANLPGITTNLQVWKESSSTATSTPNAPIPDDNLNWTVLPVTVTLSQKIARLSFYLNVTHTFRGDVEAYVQSPDGSFAQVWASSADGADNINQYFPLIEFNGMMSNGIWKLWIRDVGAGDLGTVNQFKVIPYFMAYGSAGTTTTNASGNYTFSNLDAGKYKVYPSEAGRTFAPSSILVDLGPNATGKNFLRNP